MGNERMVEIVRQYVDEVVTVTDDDTASCTAKGIVASVGSTPLDKPSPYGHSYFLDVASAHYERIDNATACRIALASFPPGPYSITPPLTWSY